MFYNVNTSKSVVQLFHILLFTGNTCIYSFLSVFLRHLGLSAFQVGLLRGLQSFTSLLCIPLVVICGRKCLQRRPPMMACLFLTMAAYLSLLVISLPAPSCFHKDFPLCENSTIHQIRNGNFARSTTESFNKNASQNGSVANTKEQAKAKLVTEPLTVPVKDIRHLVSDDYLSSSNVQHKTEKYASVDETSFRVSKKKSNLVMPTSNTLVNSNSHLPASSLKFTQPMSSSSHNTKVNSNLMLSSQGAQYYPSFTKDDMRDTSTPRNPSYFYDTSQWYPFTNTVLKNNQRMKRSNSATNVKALRNATVNEEHSFHQQGTIWPPVDISCLVILLLILLIAEASASPVETIASDAWYNYLDEIDYLVAYTKRSVSVPIFSAITVFLIGFITLFYCGISPALNAYNLHIYTFGIFSGFALVVTFFYPFPQEQKTFYRKVVTIGHSLQSKEAFALFITAVISGILQSAMTDFTLWFIEDIGGSEFITSTAVAVALLAIAMPQVCIKKTQSVFSRSAMVAFGMFCSAALFLVYVAIQIPWVIVAAQLLHFGSTYVFWTALKQRLMKVLKLKSEHPLTLTLKGFNLLGYTIGVVLNGLLYTYSPTLLFSTMALLALVWCLVLFFCEFCCLHQVPLSVPEDREEEIKLFDDLQQDSDDD